MAKQTRPFESPISLGYTVWRKYEDEPLEVEGTIYFDDVPIVGDVCILSDGKEWKVKEEPDSYMNIVVERK